MHSILILLVVIFGFFIEATTSDKRKVQKRLVIWGGVILFLYGALRSVLVGTDIAVYANTYLMLPGMKVNDIFISETLVSRDPIFYLFLKILTYISKEPQFMLIITSAIVAICFSVFVYRNSYNPILSFTMFIGLRFYSFTLSGLRQAIAWSLVMLSYKFIKDKKLLKFILMVSFASLFHTSAILFVIAYPLANIKKIEKISVLIVLGVLINFATNNLILKLVAQMPGLRQYENYLYREQLATTGMTIITIYICILIFAYVMRKRIVAKDNNIFLEYNLSIVGAAITTLTLSYPDIFRLGYYFIFPIVLLLPSSINNSFDKWSQGLINFVVIVLLVAQFILIGPGAGTENYQFFWNFN